MTDQISIPWQPCNASNAMHMHQNDEETNIC
jgi:hypothetical protein